MRYKQGGNIKILNKQEGRAYEDYFILYKGKEID